MEEEEEDGRRRQMKRALREFLKTFCCEIIIDKHTITSNNAEIPYPSHPLNSDTLHNYGAISQPGN